VLFCESCIRRIVKDVSDRLCELSYVLYNIKITPTSNYYRIFHDGE